MAGRAPNSPNVEVFMTKEEALFAEWENVDSQQGSSSEGAHFSSVPSASALSHIRDGLSGRQVGEDEVDSNENDCSFS